MTSNYKSYLEYLESFADSHSLAVQAETSIYPLFTDLKNLINHYQSTIENFATIQKDLINFIERLEFDEKDFDYYQYIFQELKTIEEHLQELKSKQVSPKVADEIKKFIFDIYNNTSLHSDISKVDEHVLAKINYTYDLKRGSGCLSVIILFIVAAAILSFTIIKH